MKILLKFDTLLLNSHYVFVSDQEKDFSDQFVTMAAAAIELGVSEARVRKAVADEVLPHVVMFARKLVRRADLDEYRSRTQPDGSPKCGRPRKPKSPPP